MSCPATAPSSSRTAGRRSTFTGRTCGRTGGCRRAAADRRASRPNFTDIGSYALLNFRADYDFTENFSTAVGVTNLLDQNYALADGFPEPGRQFYATARAKF